MDTLLQLILPCGIATIRIFHLFQLPDFVDLELGVLSVMVNDAYLLIIPYSQHCFLWNFVFYSRKTYLAQQYKKMLCHPYSYRSTIDENTIPLQRICVSSYLCLLLTKVLFETSFKSFQNNTEGRRLSNYSIKLILCSHHRSRCKGLCQNKKHEFDQYTKGSHFCAAHMALSLILQSTKEWSLPASVPCLATTTMRLPLHRLLIIMWSIWFFVWPSGEFQVT